MGPLKIGLVGLKAPPPALGKILHAYLLRHGKAQGVQVAEARKDRLKLSGPLKGHHQGGAQAFKFEGL